MRLITLLLAFCLSLPVSAAAQGLPDMGDSSASALSAAEEQRIGREMITTLRQRGQLLDDPEINAYVESLGYRLATHQEAAGNRFTFVVIDAPEINAFALPGGFIGVNAGLIVAAQSESELAAVLAHEIAHVTQRHIARSVEHAGESSLPLTAALIAAIILSSQNPDAGQAAIAAAMGGQAQMRVDFTRANEQEADRIGIELLAGAGYHAGSMADFFARLQRESRFRADVAPEFLRTHPVNDSRIADAQHRAAEFGDGAHEQGSEFRFLRTRLEVMQARDPAAVAERLAERAGNGDAAARYGHALALARSGEASRAEKMLRELHREHPERIAVTVALGRLLLERGANADAAQVCGEGLSLYPGNELLLLCRGEALVRGGDAAGAQQSLRSALRDGRPQAPQLYKVLAQAEAALGHEAASRLAQAEYHYARGELHAAIDHLRTARSRADDFYYGSRIEARLEDLEREAKALEAKK